MAESAGAPAALAEAHITTGWTHICHGRLVEGRGHVERAIAISRGAADAFHESLGLSLAGCLETWTGAVDAALEFDQKALRLARQHNLVLPLLFALFGNGLGRTTRGDYQEGHDLFREGLALSERVGDEVWYHRFLNCQGWLHIELGDLEIALDLNRRGAEGARKRGNPETQANAQINLGDILVVKGDLALAQELLDEVHRMVDDPAVSGWMKWRYSTYLFASLGELWLARGDLARAREFADRCLAIATRTASRKYLAWGWRLAGEIARARRQGDEAERALGEALAAARFVRNPTQLWKTLLALGRLRDARGRPEAAQEAYQAARGILERVKAGLRDEPLRASVERAPVLREVYELGRP